MLVKRRETLPEEERKSLTKLATETLWNDEGSEALEYLVNTRGIKEETLKLFNVGFCPQRVNHEFSNRIITPVHDTYGDIVAISSRRIKDKNFYHESFNKSLYLYGLYFAKEHILKYNKAIVVEGEFDTMFLHSHDIPIAVGLCGSSFSIFQASLLCRYCSNIYVIYDSDKKYEQSFKRVMKMYNQYSFKNIGINFYMIRMPFGFDPDDYIKEYGRERFLEMLKNTQKRISNV
jgi:DNA primase